MEHILLNIADVCERSQANGPGLRSVVWVQGCTIGCPGCFNPHTHPHKSMRLTDPKELARRLLRVPDVDGITISGGEPFEQAEACAMLARTVQHSGRSVMVFSGYRFGALVASSVAGVREFLSVIDLLIAGPYVRTIPGDGTHWRGSSNQTAHFLTDRLISLAKASVSGPVVEITLDGRSARSTGFPAEDDVAWLDSLILERGAANAGGAL